MKKVLFLILIINFLTTCYVASAQQPAYKYAFQNPALSTEERVADLVSRMTLKEKADQLLYTAPAIPRLGIPAYNWWNEALHGVARAGYATVFPQSFSTCPQLRKTKDLFTRLLAKISVLIFLQ